MSPVFLSRFRHSDVFREVFEEIVQRWSSPRHRTVVLNTWPQPASSSQTASSVLQLRVQFSSSARPRPVDRHQTMSQRARRGRAICFNLPANPRLSGTPSPAISLSYGHTYLPASRPVLRFCRVALPLLRDAEQAPTGLLLRPGQMQGEELLSPLPCRTDPSRAYP